MIGHDEVEAALDRAEAAVDAGRGLRGTGFWPAVDIARRDRAIAERYANRISAVDRRAFETGVRLRMPGAAGLILLVVGTLAGFAAVGIAFIGWGGPLCGLDGPCEPLPWWASGVFFVGFGLVLVCTHSLTHWVVGRLVGIRFTHVFLGGPPPPRPGLKIDYASYLRTSPRARAVMHASGAVVTKLIPFAFLGPAFFLYFGWTWLTWLLLGIGIIQIVTDVTISTKVSDWKKVSRELQAARSG